MAATFTPRAEMRSNDVSSDHVFPLFGYRYDHSQVISSVDIKDVVCEGSKADDCSPCFERKSESQIAETDEPYAHRS